MKGGGKGMEGGGEEESEWVDANKKWSEGYERRWRGNRGVGGDGKERR